jgi:chromosomal replication initiation ATPase DnaA
MRYYPGLSVVAELVERASAVSHIPKRVLLGAARDQGTCRVRYAIMFCARQYGLSTPQIGRGLGDRDHSTICNGLFRASKLATDSEFRELVNAIEFKPEQEAA